ncbi:unnamed protein product [Paramecium pentaurelia]|uniref:Uncharacterized protein n=1 Tax=Paramecium pentaurelia TaxID=43138 RepID=A0A8S1YG63_9CILI|nr:unnamed protein product [Paramecium pentaurelia]
MQFSKLIPPRNSVTTTLQLKECLDDSNLQVAKLVFLTTHSLSILMYKFDETINPIFWKNHLYQFVYTILQDYQSRLGFYIDFLTILDLCDWLQKT